MRWMDVGWSVGGREEAEIGEGEEGWKGEGMSSCMESGFIPSKRMV